MKNKIFVVIIIHNCSAVLFCFVLWQRGSDNQGYTVITRATMVAKGASPGHLGVHWMHIYLCSLCIISMCIQNKFDCIHLQRWFRCTFKHETHHVCMVKQQWTDEVKVCQSYTCILQANVIVSPGLLMILHLHTHAHAYHCVVLYCYLHT